MNITLDNLTVYPELSEETYCFKTDLLVDGVKIATASNRGNGGATIFTPYAGKGAPLRFAQQWAEQQPPVKIEGMNITIPMDLEIFVNILIEQANGK